MKKSAVIGSLIFLVGCLMFCVAMSVLNWDFTKLSNRPPYEKAAKVVEDRGQTITLDSSNVAISVGLSQDDKIHFLYAERKQESYVFDQNEDITIRKAYTYAWYDYFAVMDFHQEPPFTILLPAQFSGKLNLTTSNAKVELAEVSAQNIVAVTSNGKVIAHDIAVVDDMIIKTSNNAIDLSGLYANGSVELTANNGAAYLTDISAMDITARTSNNRIDAKNLTAADSIDLKTNNGKLEFSNISAQQQITLATSNHAIEGVLSGEIGDYSITSKTSNGKNSLPERLSGGEITLDVSTSNGSIDISFDNP